MYLEDHYVQEIQLLRAILGIQWIQCYLDDPTRKRRVMMILFHITLTSTFSLYL